MLYLQKLYCVFILKKLKDVRKRNFKVITFFFFKYCHFLKVILDFLISNLQQSFQTICFNSNLYCLVNIKRGKYVILLPWQSRKNTEFMVLVMRWLCPLALLYSTIITAYINQILVNLCFLTKNRFTLYKSLIWFLSGSEGKDCMNTYITTYQLHVRSFFMFRLYHVSLLLFRITIIL